MNLLFDEIAKFTPSNLPGVRVPKKKIVLVTEGYVDPKSSSVVPHLAEEWLEGLGELQSRELVYLFWLGASRVVRWHRQSSCPCDGANLAVPNLVRAPEASKPSARIETHHDQRDRATLWPATTPRDSLSLS